MRPWCRGSASAARAVGRQLLCLAAVVSVAGPAAGSGQLPAARTSLSDVGTAVQPVSPPPLPSPKSGAGLANGVEAALVAQVRELNDDRDGLDREGARPARRPQGPFADSRTEFNDPDDPRLVNLNAGVCAQDAVVAFRRAAAMHSSDLKRLAATDGIWIQRQLFAIDTHSYETFLDGLRRYRGRTAALVFAHDKQTLCSWLITADGVLAYHRARVTSGELYGAVLDYRFAVAPQTLSPAPPSRRDGGGDGRGREAATSGRPRGPERPPNRLLTAAELRPFEDRVRQLVLPPPIAARLSDVANLIVVPIGPIAAVPFGALRPYGDGRYLAETTIISVAPGLAEVGIGPTLTRARSLPFPFGRAIVVGNPDFADAEWSFPALPGAEAEARLVAERLQSPLLKGPSATAGNIRALAEADGSVGLLYFATHAVADADQSPLDERAGRRTNRSFLALAGGGRLTLEDIRAFRLAPRALVVLSACQTGLGAVRPAGIAGLAREFHLSGASSVLMSLWSVNDAATGELMSEFLDRLLRIGPPHSVAAALSAAAAALRERRPHPAYWAPFTVFGVEQFE